MSYSKIPTENHWAIITTSSYFVPGDERSRTNPGHGYPEHSIEQIEYESFTDVEKFKQQIVYLQSKGRAFRAMEVNPCKIEVSVSVKIV